jgi:hypothetical protein
MKQVSSNKGAMQSHGEALDRVQLDSALEVEIFVLLGCSVVPDNFKS